MIHGFKFLKDDLSSSNDPEHVPWKMGKWRKHDGPLEMCSSGFHASEDPYDSLKYVYGSRWLEIEAKGKIVKAVDKFVAEEMRIVKELPTKRIVVRFAIACARHMLDKFETKYPDDGRPRKAIEAAEAWMKKPTKETESAAWSAASAARSAESAAWSAESAAWSAESAAWSAEIDWQRHQLAKIVDEEATVA